jgi:hypothetical protein
VVNPPCDSTFGHTYIAALYLIVKGIIAYA